MTSSVGIACQSNSSVVLDQASKLKVKNRFDFAGARPCTVAICDHGRSGWKSGRISATMTAGGLRNRMSLEPLRKKEGGGKNDAVDAYERLDKWMQDSVVDIVKNLKEAPLLVQLYSNSTGKGGGKTTALSTEKNAAAEDWPAVKEKWEAGETPLPEGIIFVEELEGYEAEQAQAHKDEERTTRAWGLVVQGKGIGCGPVCYLLKTSRVGSGMGMFCTHFCLMRVKNFWETVDSQLKNCWLLQSH